MDWSWHNREWLEWLLRLLESLAPHSQGEQWLEGETGSVLGAVSRGKWHDRSAWVGAKSTLEEAHAEWPSTYSYRSGIGGTRPSASAFTSTTGALTTGSFGNQAIEIRFGRADPESG